MATVRYIISLLVFLLAVDCLASNAWPVTSSHVVPGQGNLGNLSDNQQPIGRLAGGSPLSISSNSRGDLQIATLPNASSTSLLTHEDATVPRLQSSSQPNNGSPPQLYSRDLNHIKPISNLNRVLEQPMRPDREIPLVVSPSKQNSNGLRIDKSTSFETDRLIEGSGMGPVHVSRDKEAKSKLDDTEESDDDDEDYDETLDTGSGHGILSKKPSSPLPSNTVVTSSQSDLREQPQQSDFYKPFRPPPQSASPSPVATVDTQLRRPNNRAHETVSSLVAAREAPAQVTSFARNVTAPFAITTPAPPRVPSVIATLATPALIIGETPVAQNRSKSEPDYEDEEESEDEDDGETSAFEDNDTSEADAATGAVPRRPMPGSNSTSNGLDQAMRPLDKVHHSNRPHGFDRPYNASASTLLKPGTSITSPAKIPPSLPPTSLARPMTPPTVRPSQTSVTSSSSSGDQVNEEEEEDVEEDEEEEEEDEDDELASDGKDIVDQYPFNNTRPIMGNGDNQNQRPPVVPLKPPTMQTSQNNFPTSAPYPSQHNRKPIPLASGQAPVTSSPQPAASSSQPPKLAAPVNHEATREPHYVTTTMPTRMPATPATNMTPPTSKLTVPILPSQLPATSTSFVPTNPSPSYKLPSILNAATSVTTSSSSSQQPQPPTLMPTTRGNQQQQQQQKQTTGLVNSPPPLPATTNTIATPQDKPRSHFTTLDPRPSSMPTMQFAAPPTNRGVDVLATGQTNRALRDNNVIAADDTLTKQIYDKAVEVYHEADKAIRAAWEAVWPPNMNFDSASMEPLLTQPLFFMLALGGAIICLVLLMMLVVYIISYQIQPKVDDDISIY